MLLKSPNGILASSLEPLRKAHYAFSFQSPVGEIISSPTDLMHLAGGSGISDQLTTEKFVLLNSEFEIPTLKPSGQIKIPCRFMTNPAIFKKWKKWRDKVYNRNTDTFGLFDEFVGSGALKLFETSSGGSTPAPPTSAKVEIKLIDIYPLTVDIDDLSSEDDGASPLLYTVTLSVGDVD